MHLRSLKLAPVALLALAACAEPNAPAVVTPAEPQPLYRASAADEHIPGQYIVVYRDAVTDVQGKTKEKALKHGATVKHTYASALKGFAAELTPAAVAALRADPDVAYVEQDQVMRASTIQTGATWGLDRIDQRALPLSTSFAYTNTGLGVTAYIIDTGILLSHVEVVGRASSGYDAVTAGGTAADCNGHGTHVAGTVGGTTYGVAKAVSLVAVRVLDCGGSGSNAGVIAGIDWVTANHVSPAVANMSLGGGASTALDDAVRRSIASGVTYAIAAGNGFLGLFAQNACNGSPSRVTEALIVSATNNTDTKPSWANTGSCVDLFAPGIDITSSWYTSNTATNTISGTSMATPHVAGVAALYLQSNASATPAAVQSAIIGAATTGVVKSAGTGSPNRLLYTAY